MSCPKLVKLVKTYTYGEIPLEVYREQRRQIVNDFTNGAQNKKPGKKSDPLETFIASAPAQPATHKQLYFAIAGATLAVGLAVMIGIFFFPSVQQDSAKTPNAEDQAAEQSGNKSHAQKLIDKFLLADNWNEESINQFILDWQILSADERQQAQDTNWFRSFKAVIQNQLDKQKNSVSQTDRQREDLLTSLIATIDPGHFINGAFFGQASNAQADQSQSTASAPPPLPATVAELNKKAVTVPQKPTGETPLKESPPEKSKATVKQKPIVQKSSQPVKVVDSKKVEIILKKFVQSFEKGNLNGLMELFSPNATTNHHTSADEIRASYAELFQTTAKRDLQFSNFSWKLSGNQAEGNGKYLAHLNPNGTNIEQIFSADVTILMDQARNPAVITGLYLTNQQFSTSLIPSVKAAIPEAQKIAPPEKDELRTLLHNFVTSYNRGDIEELMSLFSQEARTNDRSNINDIRRDYTQLFQTTKSREIILSDITWKINANHAVASGLFEVKVQPLNKHETNIYRGKIRIAVTKFEGGLLITQLLHSSE